MTSSVVRIAVLTLVPLLVACGGGDDPTPPPPDPVVSRLAIHDPLPISATVGASFAPTVRAFDANNRAVAGATLRFTSARGTTTIQNATATTDASGIAAPGTWQLPTTPTVDTLIVTAEGTTGVAPLRIPMAVNAGAATRFQALVATTGSGVLLQSMLAGPAFQVFDQFNNPIASAVVTVEITPADGARVPLTLSADEQGIVRVAEWTPRVSGTHTLRVSTPSATGTLTSAALTRTVSPTPCAPLQAMPFAAWNAAAVSVTRTGTLATTRPDGCPGTPDRWAFGTDSARVVGVDARVGSTNAPMTFSIVRAGVEGPAGVVVPEILGRASCTLSAVNCGALAVLAPGEYEVRVGTAASAPTSYSVAFLNQSHATFVAATNAVWVGRGADVVMSAGTNFDLPGTPVPVAYGRLFLVNMRDPAQRSLLVQLDIRGNVDDPRIIVYGRTSPTATPVYLGTGTTTFPQRNANLTIPAEYVEALVYVVMERRAPTSIFDLEYRLRIN
jgi:hypothetical protein